MSAIGIYQQPASGFAAAHCFRVCIALRIAASFSCKSERTLRLLVVHMDDTATGLEENAKSKDGPMQSGTDGESPALHSVAFTKMHAAVPHRNPKMTSKLPLGTTRCGYVDVCTYAKSPTITVD